ncbi:MAG: hypothetical protein WCJ87_13380 [Burkholderiales bacterium]
MHADAFFGGTMIHKRIASAVALTAAFWLGGPSVHASLSGRGGEMLYDDMLKVTWLQDVANHACGYRLRVGNYRVFFDFDGAVHIVTIEEVRKCDERTY